MPKSEQPQTTEGLTPGLGGYIPEGGGPFTVGALIDVLHRMPNNARVRLPADEEGNWYSNVAQVDCFGRGGETRVILWPDHAHDEEA